MKRSPLTPNPERVREWLQRSRAPLKRTDSLERRTRLKPGKRKTRWRVPAKVRALVLERSAGLCCQCCARAGVDPYSVTPAEAVRLLRRGLVRPAAHLHHVLPVERWPDLERDPDNMMGVCPECHDEHERAHVRILRRAVPGCASVLALVVGAAEFDYITRTYPREGPTPGGTGPSR